MIHGSPGRQRLLSAALVLAIGWATSPVRAEGPDPSLLEAPHFENGRFFNPWEKNPKSAWDLFRWKLFTPNPYDKARTPEIPRVENDGLYLSGSSPRPSATWVGHSTFAVHDGDDVFLTDPHFSRRALLPHRITPPGIPIESIPGDAFAVISHNHYDHLDADTVDTLPETVQWFVPLGLAEWFRDRGRPNVVELDWWESAHRGRWTITCLPSQHWSQRIEQGTNRSLWCSWLLDSGETRYYFGGDTGYFPGFAEFGRRFAPIDVAMLPIGAYEPRWMMRYNHMDPTEAFLAFRDLGARQMLPMHWGTFDLTDEPADLPPQVLGEIVEAAGGVDGRVHVPAIGERVELLRFPRTGSQGSGASLSNEHDPENAP